VCLDDNCEISENDAIEFSDAFTFGYYATNKIDSIIE